MNTTRTIGDHRELTGHDQLQKKLVFKDRKWRVTYTKENAEHPDKYGQLFHIVTTVLVALAAWAILEFTGLYYGMESIIGKAGLIALIVYCYLAAFRRGLYSG